MNHRLAVLALSALLTAWGCAPNQLGGLLGNTKVSMKLKNGEKIEGTVLQNGDGGSTMQLTYGTVTVTTGDIASVESSEPAPLPTVGIGRLAKWDHCLHTLVSIEPPLPQVSPIAATVIDKGIFRNVPYLSHRFGEIEFNIYGDPDEPAGLEIGIYDRAPSPEQRRRCLHAISQLLPDMADRNALMGMNLERSSLTRGSLTFEITPATAEDAYGGWWISIYDVRQIDQQRATPKELAQITVDRAPQAATPVSSDLLRWREQEIKMARPGVPGLPQGRVFLRGIHRKNGVYVAPTTL
ncbi:MAG: hypothetical protein JO332_10305 [Planctomycetaceae bacterium]|nr:hypothetical protein [Planctomycetaceae bacterium]